MAARGRPPGQGKVPGSGRKKGSLDRTSRLLISERLAFDILKTYEKLGPDWLLTVAKERPDLFINQCLSKLLPPAFKEDLDAVNNNTQNNYYNLSPLDAARRVAFALNLGIRAQDEQALQREPALIEVTGRTPAPEPAWVPPAEPAPEPVDDLQRDMGRGYDRSREREQWAQNIHLTPEQRADNQLIRETVEADITNYRGGSSAEQFDALRRPSSSQPSAGDRRRAVMSRRGRDLL
ncbi:hypothetical protein [Pseudomonas sp. H9]|uniref:hypothetical protein n=1 Tax=Pseudomonas sp. H9 TaxID=483968 RepID=UPI00105781C7|nr:hypothetical protein [Pseudomonas sp. H9]TDF77706.1 hypothetical protein E1573_26520 [Pseudomonas sp. H9]